jgi:hypothetical protein
MVLGPSDYISWISAIASILSLLAAGYAAYGIRSVREEMIARVRLPALLDATAANASALTNLMPTYNEVGTKRLFDIELAKCTANLKMIRQKLTRAQKNSLGIDTLLDRLAQRSSGHLSTAEAWSTIAALNGFNGHLKGVLQEHQLGA